MKKRLARISPLQLGIVLAVLYAVLSLIVILPLGAISMAGGAFMQHHGTHSGGATLFTGVFLFLLPVLYAVLGFVVGVLVAAIYNLVASFTGGIEVTVEDAPAEP